MLIAVLSLKGSPGTTTFSVALAARWPSPARPLIVEVDPSGGDIATRFSLESSPGLLSLTAAARRNNDPAAVWQHAQALPGGLPVVAAPPDADRARAALSALTADQAAGVSILRAAANAADTVVVADCGRIDAGSPALPIVRCADAMVLLTRAHADDLAHLARRLPAIGRWNAHPVMLLVGEGYSSAEVAHELGVPPLGRVPDDPHGAGVLCGRPSSPRWGRGGPAHSALGHVAHRVAKVLVARQPPPPTLPHQWPEERQTTPALRAIPGVPANPVSINGLRLAPPIQVPDFGSNTSRGGQAS
ncbi:chromosome partitioning protein [Amycolatopsis sp. H20-H5]|uniref:chromosome partitioning protein n=1 Tax=Amycolatopsis sp. H20-H5 TaxID=3046309 RepID=UPI002DBD331D|nr:chromosome partitioning protein [Amycolatopsis sp. H20-H5]MEC3978893.1 chromosome partitioning protein [Amycolatopsis sp. H20-H5]